MDDRSGLGIGRLLGPAITLMEGMDRRPARSPNRVATAPRRNRGALIAKLLIAAAVTASNGCAPVTPPTTSVPGPMPPPAAAQPPQTPASEPVASVLYADGMAITKTGTVTVDVGSRVTLRVVGDVADEVHLHGYDRRVDAAPGQEVGLSFTADTPGVFTVELENLQAKLVEVEVV